MLGGSEAKLYSSLRKSLVAGSSAGSSACACRGTPLPDCKSPGSTTCSCAMAALPAELCLWGVVGAAGTRLTTSASSSQAGWKTWRDPSPLPRSTRNSGLCLAVGWRRCRGMASCFNSFGPAQTYVISRVWAHSHTLLAGLPFPLNPLQSGFAAGIGWGGFGVLGASPGVMQGSVNSSRGISFLCKIAGGERGAVCTNLMHLLGLVTEQGVKQREEFISKLLRAVKTSFTNGDVFVQVSVHGKI